MYFLHCIIIANNIFSSQGPAGTKGVKGGSGFSGRPGLPGRVGSNGGGGDRGLKVSSTYHCVVLVFTVVVMHDCIVRRVLLDPLESKVLAVEVEMG